ncbi:MAG TPA: Ig-like domain repeat protein [Terriglobales bacterium]
MPLVSVVSRRALPLVILMLLASFVHGQASSFSSNSLPVDESNLVTLTGNTHPLALAQYDQGSVAGNQPLTRMLLVLKRSPAQDAALRRLLDDQQDKSSPSYHKWLTPTQYGQQFGPSDSDLQKATSWLKLHGFEIARVSKGRTVIEFSGTVAQVEAAFHTSMHRFLIDGVSRIANASDPQIPASLSSIVAGPLSLNSFPKKPMSQVLGTYSKATGKLQAANPDFTFPGGCAQDGNCYALVPYDFATIYNVSPLWDAGIDGTGQTIAIVGRTNINIQDVRDFRTLFGLPANDPEIILNGPDPGINEDESEADVDVQWSGAVAKNAAIKFVTSASTETSDGVDLSAEYIVDNNLAPVMSESYGLCELGLGTAGNQFFNALWAQAAAQGITVMISTGDDGSAGCDFFTGFVPQPAQYGLAVNGISSTPFNVAVGGTDFNDFFSPQDYWNTTNDPTTQASAKGYIPESTWNSTCTNAIFGQVGYSNNAETNCNNFDLISFVETIGGSGGVSNCTTNTQQVGSCSGGYAKPSWQTGIGVPADGKRDLPDLSLFSSSGFLGNFYIICQSDVTYGICSLNLFVAIGGTSVASPAFAGVMALVNQQTGSAQGNANYVLYKLAAQQSTAFHDITSGTISMPCDAGSPNCTVTSNGYQFGTLSGYNTTAGYDLATGLGTVNVANLVNKWSSVTFKPSTTTLSLTPTTVTHGQTVTINSTVAPTSGSGTPTGNISLLTSTGKSAGDYALASGSFSGPTKLLPGGAYTVSAHYGGDPTYGGSDSAPVSVTVNPESSKTVVRMITFDSQGNITNQNATSTVYGSPYLLRMDVTDAAGDVCGTSLGCPTGSVALTDNGVPLDTGTFVLNNVGYAEDQIAQLPGGTHTLAAQFVGDSSFNASSAGDTLTITPAATSFYSLGTPGFVSVGENVSVYPNVQSQSTGAAPGGTFTFTLDGAPLSGTLTTNSSDGQSSGVATISGDFLTKISTSGVHTLVATYTGDSNYSGSSSSASITALYQTTFSLSVDNPNPAPNSSITLTGLVSSTAQNIWPTGSIQFGDQRSGELLNGNLVLKQVTDGSGNAALQATMTIIPPHNSMEIGASYAGDGNFNYSNTPTVFVTVTGSDFAIYPMLSNSIELFQGTTGSLVFNIDPQASFNGTINFNGASCSGLPAESSCSFNPSTVTGKAQTFLTVSTSYPHSRTQAMLPKELKWWYGTMSAGLVGVFLLGARRKRWCKTVGLLIITGTLFVIPSCGGGGGDAGGGGGVSDPGTPKGTYTVTVTATSGSLTHTTTFTLTVK